MPTHVERVVVLGDSLSLGLGTENRRGWVQQLHERYDQLNADQGEATQHPRIFYELGTFAAKSHQFLDAVEHEVPPRFWLPEEPVENYDRTKRLSIVSIGTNDSWIKIDPQESVVPIATYTQRMGHAARLLAESGEVLFVGLFPSDPEKCGDFWGTPGVPEQQESRLEFEAAAIDEFRKVGAHVIPLAQKAYDSPEYMQNFTPDGVHGNAASEDWVYRQVVPTFENIVL